MYKRKLRAKGLMRSKNYITRAKAQKLFIYYMDRLWPDENWWELSIGCQSRMIRLFATKYKNVLKGYSGNVMTLCEDTIKEVKLNKLIGM